MTTIGFTGTRDLPPEAWAPLRQRLATLYVDEFVTGACRGVDAFAGENLARLHPEARHTVLVPANRRFVDYWWLRLPAALLANVDVLDMPDGTSYAYRNAEIVRRSQRLIAVPVAGEDDPGQRRSGTWQTVRMGRRKGIMDEGDVWMVDELVEGAA
jgi:hypothetical protein